MRSVEQQLEKLSRGSGRRPLLEPRPERGQSGRRPRAEARDLVPEVRQRRPHPRGGGVDALEARAESDEVRVVAVDEADELGAERGEVGAELGGEALERDVGAELGDVRVRVEVGAEEGVGLEPWRVRLDGLPEEVRRRGRGVGRRRGRHAGCGRRLGRWGRWRGWICGSARGELSEI